MPTSPSRFSRWPAVALAIISVALAFGTVEAGLRFLRPRHTGLRGLLYQASLPSDYRRVESLPQLLDTSVLGYRPRTEEDGYILNSRGLRTHEYETAKLPATLRVLALGDSFAFGGVPDREHWCLGLEEKLASHVGGPVEVLRLGVPGVGPPFYLRMWQLEGARLQADAVVVGLFVGNDFFDEQGRRQGWRGLIDQAAALSYAVRLTRNLARLDPTARRTPVGTPRPFFPSGGYELSDRADLQQIPTFSPKIFAEIERERMTLCLRNDTAAFAIRLERVVRVLRELSESVEQVGARLIVMMIPDEYQVSPDVAAMAAGAQGRPLSDYDLLLPQRALAAALAGEGIEAVDLLPAFRATRGPLYVPRDTHWNRAGHALASDALAAILARGGKAP